MKALWQLVRSLDRELRRSVSNRWAWLRLVAASRGRVAWDCIVRVTRDSRVVLGDGSYCSHGTVLAAKSADGRPSSIHIGSGTSIGEYNNLRAEGADIVIGDRCLLAQFVSIIASGHEYKRRDLPISQQGVSEKRGVVVEDDVWIGVMVTILPGVTLGRGCVVGSGAVVTRDVPAYAIVVGNPAKVVGERS